MSLFLLQALTYGRILRRMRPRGLIFLIFIISTLPLTSGWSAEARPEIGWGEWSQAKSRFDSKQWQEAIAELLAHPRPLESSYHHNLGTTYLYSGEVAPAVAHLEKANRLRPHQPDIQNNLNLARQRLGEKMGQDRLDPASSGIEQLADQVPQEEVRANLAFFTLCLILVWIRNFSRSKKISSTFLHPASYLAMSAEALSLLIYLSSLWASHYPPAMILHSGVIRSGPGEHFQQLEQAECGVKVRILGPSSEGEGDHEIWNQVRYDHESIGWIQAKNLMPL
jgi:hypothetical protein